MVKRPNPPLRRPSLKAWLLSLDVDFAMPRLAHVVNASISSNVRGFTNKLSLSSNLAIVGSYMNGVIISHAWYYNPAPVAPYSITHHDASILIRGSSRRPLVFQVMCCAPSFGQSAKWSCMVLVWCDHRDLKYITGGSIDMVDKKPIPDANAE